MNKEKILLDFAVFVLLDIEELCSYLTHFFVQNQKNNDPFTDYELYNYEEFIRNNVYVSEILENDILKPEIKNINDFLSTIELNNLKDYLNENFREGYPDGDRDGIYGGNTPLKLTNSDLIKAFNKYLKYRNINKSVFITYYIQLFDNLSTEVINKLKIEVGEIENIQKTKELLETNLSKKYIENEKNKLEKKLFKSVKKNNFQFKGFADEKGLFFDLDNTILSYLEYLNKNFINDYNYPPTLPEIEKSINYLTYQYYHFKLFGKHFGEVTVYSLQEQLEKIKLKNSNLIEFLNEKGFEENDINAIINLLNENKFRELEIRYFPIKQVEVFHVFHLFYIFDYFKEKEGFDFSNEKQFESILKLQSTVEVRKNSLNQFLKYYDNITSNKDNNHYPFKSVDKTLDKIANTLKIEKGKLKCVPIQKK